MKGIVLAGGLGSRLFPLTKVTNKHLLPVYNKPMIFFPLEKLVQAGIRDVMLVTGGYSAGDFMRLLGNGKELGLNSLSYAYQEGEGGIAHALSLTESFAGGEKVVVILGDNMVEDNIAPFAGKFKAQEKGARILLKEVSDAHRFGVAEIADGKIKCIVEKPSRPASKMAVIGLYFYDGRVYDIIRTLKPSKRGELEITDVNNVYAKEGTLEFDVLQGLWTDAGTFDSLLRASQFVSQQNPAPGESR